MKPYFIKTPQFIKLIYRKRLWSFPSNEKSLYLTFDDGPTPEVTTWVLNQLDEYNAKATFFCIGKNIKQFPEIFQDILKRKHATGNHTHNHLNGFKTSSEDYIKNFSSSDTLLNNHQNSKKKLFRPPYGKLRHKQAKQIRKEGHQIVMWDVLSADFDLEISATKCLENVVKNVKNGSIIVFHDSVKAQEKLYYVLPKILDYYTAKGYTFKAIN